MQLWIDLYTKFTLTIWDFGLDLAANIHQIQQVQGASSHWNRRAPGIAPVTKFSEFASALPRIQLIISTHRNKVYTVIKCNLKYSHWKQLTCDCGEVSILKTPWQHQWLVSERELKIIVVAFRFMYSILHQ